MDAPIPNSYWVTHGQLLAGGYPGGVNEKDTDQEVRAILEAGIGAFVDLTEEGEHAPYSPSLSDIGRQNGTSAQHRRIPIKDLGAPTSSEMNRILRLIDEFIQDDKPVYVHCWGGIGRTGTVVGCYMVEQGMTGSEALQKIEALRKPTPYSRVNSPDNEVQREMVLSWSGSGQPISGPV